MLDQPPLAKSISCSADADLSDLPNGELPPHACGAPPASAAIRHATPASPTLVVLQGVATAPRRRLHLGTGLGGVLLLAALGWMLFPQDMEDASRTTADAASTLPPQPYAAPAATATGAVSSYPDAASSRPEPPTTPSWLDSPPSAMAPRDTASSSAAGDGLIDDVTVRVEKGDTIGSILNDLDLAPEDIGRAIAAMRPYLRMTHLQIDQIITVRVHTPAGIDAKPVLHAVSIRPEARREITVERDSQGDFQAHEKTFEIVGKQARASGTLSGSLIGSIDTAGVPASARAEMVRAFSWDVNFQHDIKVGDRFDVLIEQTWTTDGKPVDQGRVLWARLTTEAGKKVWSVYRFKPQRGTEFFYYEDGQSVVKSLLRTPLNMSRISSRFGVRRHPVLGYTRMHKGVDFAAPPGTPVLAAGTGRVAQAGRNGGYGNWVKINHGRGLATGYAHMRRIARGIRAGSHVHQGQVIGYVGTTGLSTGPHLHFELHRNGTPVNPLTVARTALRARLAGADLVRFKAVVARIKEAWASARVLKAQ